MASLRSHSRRFLTTDRGVESVEVAVTFLLLATVLFAGFEYGWAMTQSTHVQQAARVGAREACLQGATAATVNARVQGYLQGLGITTADVSLLPPEPALAEPGATVAVKVSVEYATVQLLGLQGLMPLPERLNATSSMVKEPLR